MPLPRLLVCDLDGTLLNGQGAMTAATIAALRQAVAAGVEVVFATGRRHIYAWQVLSPTGLEEDTVLISSNGALVRTFSGRPLHRASMPVSTALLLCGQLHEFRSSLIFTFERTGPGSLVIEDMDTLRRTIPRWVASNLGELACVVPLERAFDAGEGPIQAMICGTLQRMQQAMTLLDAEMGKMGLLRERISLHRTEYAARDLCIVDLMPHGCSKGNAVARLAAERGIAMAEIAAIGDNMNDADMLALAGRPIVMQNAAPELLEMAYCKRWEVTASNEHDGAAQAIQRMLQGTERATDAMRDFVPAD
ncbi:MAG: HAD hydrolase family protein [Acidobacteriaceae bacterium]